MQTKNFDAWIDKYQNPTISQSDASLYNYTKRNGNSLIFWVKWIMHAAKSAIGLLCMFSDVDSNFVGIHSLSFMLHVQTWILILWHSSNKIANELFNKTMDFLNSDIVLDSLLFSLSNYPLILKWHIIFPTEGSSNSQKSEFSLMICLILPNKVTMHLHRFMLLHKKVTLW